MLIYVSSTDKEVGDVYELNGSKYTILSVNALELYTELTLSDVELVGMNPEVEEAVAKQEVLNNLTVVVNGKRFSTNDTSLSRVDKALRIAEIAGKSGTYWKLHKDTEGERVQYVTVDELREVLVKGMDLLGQTLLGISPLNTDESSDSE